MTIGDAAGGGAVGALGGAAVGAGVGAAVAAIPFSSGVASAVTNSGVGTAILKVIPASLGPIGGAAVVTGSVLAAAGLAVGVIGNIGKPKGWRDRIDAERASAQGLQR
jgi:hypothetical protein